MLSMYITCHLAANEGIRPSEGGGLGEQSSCCVRGITNGSENDQSLAVAIMQVMTEE